MYWNKLFIEFSQLLNYTCLWIIRGAEHIFLRNKFDFCRKWVIWLFILITYKICIQYFCRDALPWIFRHLMMVLESGKTHNRNEKSKKKNEIVATRYECKFYMYVNYFKITKRVYKSWLTGLSICFFVKIIFSLSFSSSFLSTFLWSFWLSTVVSILI